MRLRYTAAILILCSLMAACGTNVAPTPTPFVPSATPRGAVVPTRIPASPTATVTQTPTPSTPVAQAIRDVAVRSGPGTNYPILDTLAANDRVDILGVSEDGGWFLIQGSPADQQWITSSAAFVTTSGALASVPIAAVPSETPTPTITSTATLTATITASPTATETPTLPPTAIVTADQTTAIQIGDTIAGVINNDKPAALYSFEAQAGDIISIRMQGTSDELDSFIMLLNADGVELARDDDGDPDAPRDALLSNFQIPQDGTYVVIATRFGGDAGLSSGTFTLTLTTESIDVKPTIDPSADISTLVYGDVITSTIDDTFFENRYQFEGASGDTIAIRMTAADSAMLDPLLILLDSTGSEIASNDDLSEFSRNAEMTVTLPADDTYTIVATRYERETGDSAGEYTLELDLASTSSDERTTLVTGKVTDDLPGEIFTYEPAPGEFVTLEMRVTSGDLDPLIIVIDPAGREIARNDDYETGLLDARIENLQLTEEGEYSIIATRFGQETGNSTGDFELELLPPTDTVTNATLSRPITNGETVAGTIETQTVPVIYTFEGEEGQTVSIEMTAQSEGLDTLLTLSDSFGVIVVVNDDASSTTTDSQITNATLPEDGFYTIIAGAFSGTGDFELTFNLDGQ